jgi:hypothetical protein
MSVGGDLIVGLFVGRGVLVPLAAFIMIGIAVFAIASRLARHASDIADATGLGRLWIGTVLLAASTSLPELTVDVNAALLDTPDIGVGDLLGSTLANMLVLALLDLSRGRNPIFDNVSPNHVLVGTIGVVLTAMVGAAIASGGWGHYAVVFDRAHHGVGRRRAKTTTRPGLTSHCNLREFAGVHPARSYIVGLRCNSDIRKTR